MRWSTNNNNIYFKMNSKINYYYYYLLFSEPSAGVDAQSIATVEAQQRIPAATQPAVTEHRRRRRSTSTAATLEHGAAAPTPVADAA